MTQPSFTTIRIYKQDKPLLRNYGETQHEAFHNMARKKCPHPESARRYLTAEVDLSSANGEELETITENEVKTLRVVGYKCGKCNNFIFPASENLPVAE